MDERMEYNKLSSVRVVSDKECVLTIVVGGDSGVRMCVVPSHGLPNWGKRCRTESK